MYRYGDLNDLDFALPKQRIYDFYWPLHFNPSFVDKKYLNFTSPNMLINARYSTDTMASFMPKVCDQSELFKTEVDTPRNSWRGCAAGSPYLDPIADQNMQFSTSVFRADLAAKIHTKRH